MSFWTNRLTIPVDRITTFAELTASYQEALKDRGALDVTYKLWNEMTSAEKAKAKARMPKLPVNNRYVN